MRKNRARQRRKNNRSLSFFWLKKKLKISPFLLGVIVFSCLILAALFFIGINIYASGIFTIKKENINSNVDLNNNLKEEISGQSLFTVNTNYIYSKVRKIYPESKEVYVIKEFPSSLRIEVIEREPFAQLRAKRFYLIDREGIILDDGSTNPYPDLISVEIVEHNASFRRGNRVNDKRLNYVYDLSQILKKRPLDKFHVSLINARSLVSTYMIVDNIKVILGAEDFERKTNLLYNILRGELKDKLPSVEYIDLRYKKVYVGYKR